MDLIWFIYQLNLQARERIGIMGRTGTGMINFTKFNEFLIFNFQVRVRSLLLLSLFSGTLLCCAFLVNKSLSRLH